MLKKSHIAFLGFCVGLTYSSLASASPCHSGDAGCQSTVRYATESDMKQTLGALKGGAHKHPHPHHHEKMRRAEEARHLHGKHSHFKDPHDDEEVELRKRLFPNLDSDTKNVTPKRMKVNHHPKGAIKRYEKKGGAGDEGARYVRTQDGKFDRYFSEDSHLTGGITKKINKSLKDSKPKTDEKPVSAKVTAPVASKVAEPTKDKVVAEKVKSEAMVKDGVIEQKPISVLKPAESKATTEAKKVEDAAKKIETTTKPVEKATGKDEVKAAAAPAAATVVGNTTALPYTEGETGISSANEAALKGVISKLQADPKLKVKVQSFAHSTDGAVNLTRRISLQRAIKVRKYLIDNGVSATRINVHAVGNAANTHNKVDLILEDN